MKCKLLPLQKDKYYIFISIALDRFFLIEFFWGENSIAVAYNVIILKLAYESTLWKKKETNAAKLQQKEMVSPHNQRKNRITKLKKG